MGIVEVPVFMGVDVRPWISWMEQYFARCDDITELQKLAMAYGFIEGDALLWYCQREFETWKELRNTLLMKYGDDSDPERYWLLAEQDRLVRRLRASAIQKETTSLKLEETKSSMRGTEACCVTESMEKKEIEDEAILQHEAIGQNQLIQHNESFLQQTRLITETNSSEAIDSILETDFVHQKEAILYPQSAIVRNNQFQAQTGLVFDAVQPDHSFDVWIVPNGAAFGEMSTCVKSTPTAHRVFDSMSRQNKRIQTNMKQNKCLKSWKFKFKHSPSRRFLIQNQLWFMAIMEAHADSLLMGRYPLLKNRKTRFSKSRRFKLKHKVEKRIYKRVKSEFMGVGLLQQHEIVTKLSLVNLQSVVNDGCVLLRVRNTNNEQEIQPLTEQEIQPLTEQVKEHEIQDGYTLVMSSYSVHMTTSLNVCIEREVACNLDWNMHSGGTSMLPYFLHGNVNSCIYVVTPEWEAVKRVQRDKWTQPLAGERFPSAKLLEVSGHMSCERASFQFHKGCGVTGLWGNARDIGVSLPSQAQLGNILQSRAYEMAIHINLLLLQVLNHLKDVQHIQQETSTSPEMVYTWCNKVDKYSPIRQYMETTFDTNRDYILLYWGDISSRYIMQLQNLALALWWALENESSSLWHRWRRKDSHHCAFEILASIGKAAFVKAGLFWKGTNCKFWKKMRQLLLSRLLYKLRMRFGLRELQPFFSETMKRYMKHKWRSRRLRAISEVMAWSLMSFQSSNGNDNDVLRLVPCHLAAFVHNLKYCQQLLDHDFNAHQVLLAKAVQKLNNVLQTVELGYIVELFKVEAQAQSKSRLDGLSVENYNVMAAIRLLQRLMVQPKQKQIKCFNTWMFKYKHKLKEKDKRKESTISGLSEWA